MKKLNETDALDQLILDQEMKSAHQLEELRDQFHAAYESVKPINLIKHLFHEVTTSPEIKNDVVSNVLGLGTGFLSKKLLIGSTHNPLKKVFGTIIEFAVASLVSKNSDGIKVVGGNLLKHFINKK